MRQQNAIERTQGEASHEAVEELQAQLTATQRQLARVVELLSRQQEELKAHEASIRRLDRVLSELLTGRTWRTLTAAGKLVKKVRRLAGKSLANSPDSIALAPRRSFLVCDEPKMGEKKPRSGKVVVRGWCLAEAGADFVKIEIPGLEAIEAKPSVPRPDIKKAFPELDTTGRAGFAVEFDSMRLPNGNFPIVLRLVANGKPIRETRTSVVIDHEKGFASDYDRWMFEFERADDELIQVKLPSIQSRPLISIVTAVFNTDPAELTAAIQSVLDQSYKNWELCIADDCSTRAEIREILEGFAREDSRIKVVFQRERGGISRTCNAAWQMARGEFIAFLDHDDTLSPHALAYVCDALDEAPDADLLYSDEDKIDRKGKRFDPFFKPDWSPDLLLSENYVCHFLTIRADLAEKIGTFHSDCDGSQDYDLILRATQIAKRITHVPKVLYHWRAGVGSTASGIDNKRYALDAAYDALVRHAKASGTNMRIEPANIVGRWRARYEIAPDAHVSIIIASGGRAEVLKNNLRSLFGKTTFERYEVVVIDNSKSNVIAGLVRDFSSAPRPLRYIDWRNKPFNYSAINNAAARQCDSPVLLFLNDDTSVTNGDWLEAMMELVLRPEVGAVGAKLLYPDGRIQHAGVVMGVYDNCGHAFKGLDGSVSHYFDFSDVIRNVSAVTGACLMTKTKLFWDAGGFDEADFAVAFNDVDLCLKIGKLGYRVLYTPHAVLHHYEAFSKSSRDLVPHPEEVARMRDKWADTIAADPYYNPNLTRNDENFSLRTRL